MINSTQGGDVTGPDALKIRNLIKDLGPQFPPPKTLDAKKTAAEGGVMGYYEYLRLSLDAVHCSVTALARHRSRELINERIEHVLSIVPQTTPDEVLSTVLHACRALRATASDAYELIGFTAANATLAALETEFVSNGWLER